MSEDLLDFQPGATLPGTPYLVIRRVGAGGMGAVFEVEHIRLKKRLMAKTMHPGLRARQDFVTRMEVEAQTLARIGHPNIVQVHDLGVTDDGIPFFVMEKLEGSDLRKLLRSRRFLDLRDALAIVEDVLEALAHAHREGVVHRDIKPENIFLARSGADTVTKILDFGIVHVMNDSRNLTGDRFLGTCQYAAPEQLRGDKPSEKTDIYAVGCVLFELLTGRRPFAGPTTRDFIKQHMHDEAPMLSSLAQGIPRELDALVTSALAKDPAQRPISALWFANQLHRIQLSAANVVLAEANTTEEMLLTAITEGVASSSPMVASAESARDTDRDPGLAAGLGETTPEPRGAVSPGGRGATAPLERSRGPTPEEAFRRARTRTGKPVEIVKTEELPESVDGAFVVGAAGRSEPLATRSAGRGPAISSVQNESAPGVVAMTPLIPTGAWARRAIVAMPILVGLIVAVLVLVRGSRGSRSRDGAAVSVAPTVVQPSAPPASAGPPAGEVGTVNVPSRSTAVVGSPAAPLPFTDAGTSSPVTMRTSATSRTRPMTQPTEDPGKTQGTAPAPSGSMLRTPSPPLSPAPSPPRDDLMRTL